MRYVTGVKKRNVPNFKGLIHAKMDLEAQGCDSTFTICHALVNKAILHLKRGFVQTHLLTIVTLYLYPYSSPDPL